MSGLKEMDQSIERIDAGLQQLFPILSGNEKANNLKTLTDKYLQYKMAYVKLLSFTPEEENLSKLTFGDVIMIAFSLCAGACPIGGSVHLHQHGYI